MACRHALVQIFWQELHRASLSPLCRRAGRQHLERSLLIGMPHRSGSTTCCASGASKSEILCRFQTVDLDGGVNVQCSHFTGHGSCSQTTDTTEQTGTQTHLPTAELVQTANEYGIRRLMQRKRTEVETFLDTVRPSVMIPTARGRREYRIGGARAASRVGARGSGVALS